MEKPNGVQGLSVISMFRKLQSDLAAVVTKMQQDGRLKTMVSKVVCSVCGNNATSFIVDKWYCQTHSIPIMEQILYQTTDAMKSFAGNKTGGAQFNPTPKSERIPEFRETLRIMEAIH